MRLLYSSYSKIFLLSLISVCSQAQSDIGFKIGVSYNNFVDQQNPNRFSQIFGFVSGVTFDSKINEDIHFGADIIWEQKGSHTALTDQVIKLNYISSYLGPEINLFSENISIGAGINFGVLLNKNVEAEYVQHSTYEFKQIDFGPWIALCHDSYTSNGIISLEIRLFRGLINLNDQNSRFPLSAGSKWTNNQNLQFSLGYAFRKR